MFTSYKPLLPMLIWGTCLKHPMKYIGMQKHVILILPANTNHRANEPNMIYYDLSFNQSIHNLVNLTKPMNNVKVVLL